MPRVIRRQSTYQRISSYLNPFDFLLRLATDYEAFDWDNWQNTWGTPLGILLNMFCLIARGQADNFRRAGADDVFRRSPGSSSMAAPLSYFVCDTTAASSPTGRDMMACMPLAQSSFTAYDFSCSFFAFTGLQLWLSSWALAAFSVGNAFYCFTRKKRYRMFEQNIEVEPATPSARRVPVDSSPIANSPLRFLGSIIEPFRNDAASRAHPDESRDVWEIGVWDPTPLSLHLFALFSPVHVAIYFLSLPLASSRMSGPPITGFESSTSPAAVYFTVIMSEILLSLQIIFIKSSFIQQQQDHKVIGSQVMHEYDQKYVHPRLNVIKRDVAIQCDGPGEPGTVDVYTPQFNRAGFKTYANPNYSSLTMQSQPPPLIEKSLSRNPSWSSTPSNSPMKIRQPQFDRINGGGSGANSARRAMPSSASFDEGSTRNRGRRRISDHTGYDQPARRMGTDGLVDWSRQNSRGLSPSKASTPIKQGSSIRESTYAESLRKPFGTPSKRHQF
ncbi:hypothetical protein BDD12DRAFT_520060 [Trichophaea hybrida]|nr:hypothetical protein BDD12DRAFT_520060 [Trichophaea hybrida]